MIIIIMCYHYGIGQLEGSAGERPVAVLLEENTCKHI